MPTPVARARWLVLLGAIVGLAACGGGGGAGGGAAAAQGSAAPSAGGVTPGNGSFVLRSIQVSPFAVWADELPSVTITVTAQASTAAGVRLELGYFDGLPGGSGNHIRRAMFDDGTHGDVRANDGIWTLTFAPGLAVPPSLRLYDQQIDAIPFSIAALDAGGAEVAPGNAFDARIELAVLDRILAGQFPTRSLAAGITATEYMVNVVAPDFDAQRLAGITERLYGALGADPFDFIALFHSRATGDGIPRSLGVRNDVEGINLGQYDHSAAYGSAGRLQQLVFQNSHTLGVEVNHEFGHRWGAFLNDPALNLSLHTGFHWGPSNHVGQMGNGPHLTPTSEGRYLVENANGSETFVANAFSPLELYLMGLASPAEVAALRFVTDPAVPVRFGETLPASSTRMVSIDDIVATYGERVPSASTAQNAFTAAFVVVSDVSLSESERALTSAIARYAAGTSSGGSRGGGLFTVLDPPSFGAATGFRATLETRIP